MPPPLTTDSFVSFIASGNLPGLKHLLDQDCDAEQKLPGLRDEFDSQGDSAVHVAVKANNLEMLKFLLEVCRCKPDGPAFDEGSSNKNKAEGHAPLHFAARQGSAACVEMLCKHGATVDLKATSDGWTPLHSSCFSKRTEAALALLAAGADPSIQSAAEGATAIHFAAGQGLAIVVRQCLVSLFSKNTEAASAAVNSENNNGDTPMHAALHFNMSKMLGADKFLPPEPQWEIALLLAAAGCKGVSSKREPATFYVQKKFPAMPTAFEALAAAQLDVVATLSSSSSSQQEDAGDLYSFLVAAESSAQVCKRLVGCSEKLAAENILPAMKQLEEQRKEHRAAKQKLLEQQEQNSKKKETVLDQVVNSAAAGQEQEPSTFLDPHGRGIDIRTIKPGDDPSNGECPFLKIRADQAKARQQRKDEEDAVNNKLFEARDNKMMVFYVGAVAFAAGFFACRTLMRRGMIA